MFLSFLAIRNWNDKYVYTLLEFSRKPYPIPDETKKSLYPFSDQNAAKTIPFGAAHTYMTYIEGSTPRGGGVFLQTHGWKPSQSVIYFPIISTLVWIDSARNITLE